nr:UvrD-helicase domain-containing protein [Bacillus kexueae]
MKLTDEQLDVIRCNDRKILVKAGAGTGKTEILTRRIIRLIEEDLDLSIKDMAIITFTNKATEELQSRLKRAFYTRWKEEEDPNIKNRFRYELESLNSAQISTIHKFCNSVLETLGPYYDKDVSYSPAYKVRSDQLVKTIDLTIEEWIKSKMSDGKEIEHLKFLPVHRLKEIVNNAYTMIRTKGFNLDDIVKGTFKNALLEMETSKKKLKTELAELIKAVSINHKKFKYGRLDVEDLLEYCSKVLERRPDLCKMIQMKYKHLFIDEFQDTSLYQSEIVKKICDDSPESPNLFVVGDVKQSIYEFRGANTEAYNKIEKWIHLNGTVLTLTTNWRSTPEVVHYVNFVFDRIKDNKKYQFKRESLKPKEEKKNIDLTKAYEWLLNEENETQGEIIAKYLKNEIKQGVPAKNFTILVRKNYELNLLADYLSKHFIPFTILDSGNFYNQLEIVDTYRVLKSILNRGDLVSVQEAKSTIFFRNQEELFDSLIYQIKENKLIFRLTPSQLLDFVYSKTNIYNRCTSQVRANLNKLKEITRSLVKNENLSLYQYINWLSSMIAGNVEEPLADSVSFDRDGVQLMTIHKSKGLEFPVVILPNLDQSISDNSLYPEISINLPRLSMEFNYKKYYENKTAIQSTFYDETIDTTQFNVYSEELRVLYVALTRAKNKLVLCGSKKCKKEKICYQNWIKKD